MNNKLLKDIRVAGNISTVKKNIRDGTVGAVFLCSILLTLAYCDLPNLHIIGIKVTTLTIILIFMCILFAFYTRITIKKDRTIFLLFRVINILIISMVSWLITYFFIFKLANQETLIRIIYILSTLIVYICILICGHKHAIKPRKKCNKNSESNNIIVNILSIVVSMSSLIGFVVARFLRNYISNSTTEIVIIILFLIISYMMAYCFPYYFLTYKIAKKLIKR